MSTKPGRNDPCPCGSGKKYKHCCGAQIRLDADSERLLSDEVGMRRYQEFLDTCKGDGAAPSYMEFRGRPNAASPAAHRLHEALQGKNFADEAELQRFFERHMAMENGKPHADFLGLSSGQMHRMLHADELEELSDIVRLSEGPLPSGARECRLVGIVLYLFGRYLESPGGLGLTAKGNYRTALVAEVRDRFYADHPYRAEYKSEDRFRELGLAHDFLVMLEYVEENSASSRLSAKGTAEAAAADPERIWRDLLLFLLYRYEWFNFLREEFRFEQLRHIQDAAVFSLLLLKASGGSYLSREDLYGSFVKAFPAFDPSWGKEDPDRFGVKLLCIDYGIMFIDQFCANLGLVEYGPADASDPFASLGPFNRRFRTTELFDKALNWKHRISR